MSNDTPTLYQHDDGRYAVAVGEDARVRLTAGDPGWHRVPLDVVEMGGLRREAAQGEQKAVAYLDLGAGGYIDIGSDLSDEQLAALPKGRHLLGIIGTYGVNGYQPLLKPAGGDAVRAAYVAHFGSDAGWADRRGSWFTEGYNAALSAAPVAGDVLCCLANRVDELTVWADPETREQRDRIAEELRALAQAAHATAAKDAEIDALRTRLEDTVRESTNEIEALRAEVKDLRENGAMAVKWAPSSAHWSRDLRRLFGEHARQGIDLIEGRLRDAEARAERLAEALRKIEGFTLSQFAGPHDMAAACVDTAHRALLREQPGTEGRSDEVR